jgi:ribosomal protein S12 methylthiotransferase
MKTNTFHLISLGCAKNTVDSNSMAQMLNFEGFRPVEDPLDAEVLIVNTCGFIDPARKESYQILEELAAEKQPEQFLVAAGCLSQRFGVELSRQVPEVDAVLGTRRWMDILRVVERLREQSQPETLYHLPDVPRVGETPPGIMGAHLQGGSAYLKIADGCRRPCAFCAIPLIKGPAVSRPREKILADARVLEEQGIREINLIAQDTTDYGRDLGAKDGLSDLLEALLLAVPAVDWIRVLYAYPGSVSDRLMALMAEEQRLLPYLDMPLQHGHPDVLRRMKRPANLDWIYRTVEKLRTAIPDLALRSTFIVGYPGETREEFQALLDFVEKLQFDRLGTFTYSLEEGTAAEELGDPVPDAVKTARQEELMVKQQGISLARNQLWVGRELEVLVEGQGAVEGTGESISLGRSFRDAPEIDGMVIVEGQLPVGEIVPVRITGAMVYDLTGVPAAES